MKKIHFSSSCLPSRRKLFLTSLSAVCLSQLRFIIEKNTLEKGNGMFGLLRKRFVFLVLELMKNNQTLKKLM
jgi:hypothetical protein